MLKEGLPPPYGWVRLGDGFFVPQGLYSEDPSSSIPEGSNVEVVQSPSGVFRVVETSPQNLEPSQ